MAGIEVSIDDLLLDLENPRFDGLSSQRDALEKIVVSQGKKLVNLADDIVTEGLSPAHRMLVMASKEHKRKYVVLDGNRRLVALRILSNPSALDPMKGVGDLTRKQLKALSLNFDRTDVEPIDVHCCENDQEARHLIEAIHTGENEGRGVVGWDGVATARFRGQSASLRVLELVKAEGKLSATEMSALERFPITNLDRLLGTTDVRDLLGLVLEEGELRSDLPLQELVRGLKKIVVDLAKKHVRVTHLKGKSDRVEYVKGLGSSLPDLSKRTGMVQPIEKLAAANKKNAAAGKSGATTKKSLLDRKALIPSICHLQIDNAKMQQIALELRKLPLESYPVAIGALARVFLELSLDHYGHKHISGWNVDDQLKRKVDKVANDLQSKGMHKRDLQPFRRLASSADVALGVDRLHGVIHNQFALPTGGELRSGWDEIQHVYEKIWPLPKATP